jgi:hypothetical protein
MGGLQQWQVLHNTGVEALAHEQPLTVEDALKLPGISERKRRILEIFIPVIRKHRGV